MTQRLFLILFLLINSSFLSSVQIVQIKEDYNKKINFSNEELLVSTNRISFKFNSDWEIYPAENSQKKYYVNLPLYFNSNAELVFKNKFFVADSLLENNSIFFECPAISYFSEITINDQTVVKHPNGNLPFSIEIPKEILTTDSENLIKVKIKSVLSNETFPPLQRFLFPDFVGGIFGKIRIKAIPLKGIEDFTTDFSIVKKKRNRISAIVSVEVKERLLKDIRHNYVVYVYDDSLNLFLKTEPKTKRDRNVVKFNLEINNPQLWSPAHPNKYYVKIRVYSNGSLLDELSKAVPLYKLRKTEKGLKLNGKRFQVRGVIYVPFSRQSNPKYSYKQVEEDLKLAKNLGFNLIRFNNQIPDEKILAMANNLGLLTAVDIPLNYLPEEFLNDEIFEKILGNYYKEFVDFFGDNPNVQILGAGSSFLPNSERQINFVNKFSDYVKNNTDKFSFASFLSYPDEQINSDFIGVEFYSKTDFSTLPKSSYDKLMITATYPAFAGNKSGSLVKNSFEAQGAFYKKILKFTSKHKLSGLFINSLIDYSGDYNSLYTSYSDKHIYKIGILGIDRKAKRIAYNVIKQYFTKGKNLPVPLGANKNKIPILFIVIPLLLAVFIAFVINSRNKFREDVKRALFRSYNFFADIRDLRLLSGLHTYVLFFVNAATLSLLIEIVLFYYRSSISLDKLITAFGNPTLNNAVAFLAWHPLDAFFILFFFFIAGMLFTAFIIKFFSFFKSSKIFFTNIFYTVVWAMLPVTLLIPLELLLLKILMYQSFNTIVLILLFVYLFWLLLRLFKGIYIVFDNRPGTVYAYGFGLIFFFIFLILIIAQTSTNAVDYLLNALEQIKYL